MTTLTPASLQACEVPQVLMRNRILLDTVRKLSLSGVTGLTEFVRSGETLATMDEFRVSREFTSRLSEMEVRRLGYLALTRAADEIETYACPATGGLTLVADGEVCGYAINEAVARQMVEDSSPVGTRLSVINPELSLCWQLDGDEFRVSDDLTQQVSRLSAWRFAMGVVARFVEAGDLSLVLKSSGNVLSLEGMAGLQAVTIRFDLPRLQRQLSSQIRLALLLSAVSVTEA